eukprot:1182765-Prorocentrum_minimum.AAC.5
MRPLDLKTTGDMNFRVIRWLNKVLTVNSTVTVSSHTELFIYSAETTQQDREDITEDNYLHRVAVDTPLRTLTEAVNGADVFVGLSAGGLLKPAMLQSMAPNPLVFALANPLTPSTCSAPRPATRSSSRSLRVSDERRGAQVPEIDPNLARELRPDVIMATGRSDFPNQINNVCAFPYMFRGALDCRATCINEEMKLAATRAIADLAKEPRHTPEG